MEPRRLSLETYAEMVRELVLPALRNHRGGPTATELPPLVKLLGATVSKDVFAPLPLPSFDNSQMDGYALNTADFQNISDDGVRTVEVSQTIAAGSTPDPLTPGTVAAIMTGAAIPHGADAVVAVEDVEPSSFGHRIPEKIRLRHIPAAGSYIRTQGSDQAVGERIFAAGQKLNARSLGAAAALGFSPEDLPVDPASISEPRVDEPPVSETGATEDSGLSVLILSTGSELLEPGSLPRGHIPPTGIIYDANSTLLSATLYDYGLKPLTAAPVTDDPEHFEQQLQQLMEEHRPALIISSGGVSAGAYEVVKQVLKKHGISFTKVAMQPGGPQGCGQLTLGEHSAPLLALPGNPVSSWISVEMLLRPVLVEAGITARNGAVLQRRHIQHAPLSTNELRNHELPQPSPVALHQLRRAHYDPGSGTVSLIAGPSSHLLSALAAANAIVSVSVGIDSIQAGDTLPLWTLEDG